MKMSASQEFRARLEGILAPAFDPLDPRVGYKCSDRVSEILEFWSYREPELS